MNAPGLTAGEICFLWVAGTAIAWICRAVTRQGSAARAIFGFLADVGYLPIYVAFCFLKGFFIGALAAIAVFVIRGPRSRRGFTQGWKAMVIRPYQNYRAP